MARFDLHEQEQIDKLKYFLRDWGKYLLGGIVLILIIYITNVAWVAHKTTEANKASEIYARLTKDVLIKDTSQVYKLADELTSTYPKAEYSPMAAILAAKIAYDAKDMDKATRFLNWVINNAEDKGLIAIASLRLADVYIDQNKFDDALRILRQEHEPEFAVLFYSKRGDLYVAKGELDKARDAYKEAIEKAGQDQNTVNSIQMKLDVLGG